MTISRRSTAESPLRGAATQASAAGRAATLDGRFDAVAEALGNRTALIDEDVAVSYARLRQASLDVAARLQESGVRRGSLVALRLRRSWHVAAAILGIWRHGCGYVPIDPDYPDPYQQHLLTDCGAKHVVEDGDRAGVVISAAPGRARRRNPPARVAYVIYTSGSTGTPKGVVVTHGNVLALLDTTKSAFQLDDRDVWTIFHSHSFDFSVWELWGALLNGATAIVVAKDVATDPERFARLLEQHRVTVLNQVPSAFDYLVQAVSASAVSLPALRYVIFGGEAIHPLAIADWHRLARAPAAQLVNMYGITETTVHVTAAQLDGAELVDGRGASLIGHALPHLRVELRTPDGSRARVDEPGEIFIAGSGVSSGYLWRPDLTAERFVRDDATGAVWYRTGDWARRDEDGRLWYIGRRDEQVQLRGHRIELGEIEHALRKHPDVGACACTVVKASSGAQLLVAHVVSPAGDRHGLERELRAFAASRLPAQKRPGRFRVVEALPTNPSGKLDRRALEIAATERECNR
jgi:amino acid adenylation domain-containing protein